MARNKAGETGMDPKEARLARIESRLDEICTWLRFQNRSALRTLLEEHLHGDRDRLVYELTNGARSATEIAQAAGVTQPRISQLWSRWKELGVVMEVPSTRGRCRHICSLGELGLEISSSAEQT